MFGPPYTEEWLFLKDFVYPLTLTSTEKTSQTMECLVCFCLQGSPPLGCVETLLWPILWNLFCSWGEAVSPWDQVGGSIIVHLIMCRFSGSVSTFWFCWVLGQNSTLTWNHSKHRTIFSSTVTWPLNSVQISWSPDLIWQTHVPIGQYWSSPTFWCLGVEASTGLDSSLWPSASLCLSAQSWSMVHGPFPLHTQSVRQLIRTQCDRLWRRIGWLMSEWRGGLMGGRMDGRMNGARPDESLGAESTYWIFSFFQEIYQRNGWLDGCQLVFPVMKVKSSSVIRDNNKWAALFSRPPQAETRNINRS